MRLNSNRQVRILSALAFGLVAMSACKTTDTVGTISTGGTNASVATPTPSTTVSTVATVDAEMYMKLDSSWDQYDTTITHWIPLNVDGAFPSAPTIGSCSIPRGATPGTDSVPAATHTCNFHIPEAQLYQSKVNFIYGSTDYVNCKYMRFYPYYYEANAGANPPAAGTTPTPVPINNPFILGVSPTKIYCYGNSSGYGPSFPAGVPATETLSIYTSPECLNGAATSMAGFPQKFYILNEIQSTSEFNFKVDSGNDLGKSSNRWISNDTADRTVDGAAPALEYRLNSMHGYTLQCMNEFGVLTYEASITITADHTTGPPAAIYKSWR